MADDKLPTREFAFPASDEADDEASDARWLAGLIHALRKQINELSYPEVRAILDEAERAAQEAAGRAGKPH